MIQGNAPSAAHREELRGGERDVLVGELPEPQRVQDVVVDHRVPEEARAQHCRDEIPSEAQDHEDRHAPPGQPRRPPAEPAAERQGQGDGPERADEPERILGERGEREPRAAHEEPDAAPSALRGGGQAQQEARQAPLNGRDEQRLRAHVAAEDDEQRRGQQRARRAEAGPWPEEAGAQERRRRGREHRAPERHEPRRPLAVAEEREGPRRQPVEEGRLVEVADAVQPEREPVAARPDLPGDLRVLAFPWIVERRGAETGQEQDERERDRRHHRDRGARTANAHHPSRPVEAFKVHDYTGTRPYRNPSVGPYQRHARARGRAPATRHLAAVRLTADHD